MKNKTVFEIKQSRIGENFGVYLNGELISTLYHNEPIKTISHSNKNHENEKELDLLVKYLNLIRDFYITKKCKLTLKISTLTNINKKDSELFILKQVAYITKSLANCYKEMKKNNVVIYLSEIEYTETKTPLQKYVSFYKSYLDKEFNDLLKTKITKDGI